MIRALESPPLVLLCIGHVDFYFVSVNLLAMICAALVMLLML